MLINPGLADITIPIPNRTIGKSFHHQGSRFVEIDCRLRRTIPETTGNPIHNSVSDHLYTLTSRMWSVALENIFGSRRPGKC
jgi:hypothetical protein